MTIRNSLNIKLVVILFIASFAGQVFAATNKATGIVEAQIKLAEKGNPDAQYKLGSMYEFGIGADVNIAEATKWYAEAEKKGIKEAGLRMTYLDVQIEGFDKAKHSTWLKEVKDLAAKGNEEAAMLLGQVYSYGLGVNKDLNKAIDHLNQAGLSNPVVFYEIGRVERELAKQKAAKKPEPVKQVKQVKPKKVEKPKPVAKKEPPKQLSATDKLEARLKEKEEKRKRYEAMMKRLAEEQRILEQQQKWSEQ